MSSVDSAFLKRYALLDLDALQTHASNTDTLTAFRAALKTGREQLSKAHHANEPTDTIVYATAWLADQLIKTAWQGQLSSQAQQGTDLIAVGGYGRGELNLRSDIDLLILSKKEPSVDIATELGVVIQFLWDIGLEVGHSVRTLHDCVEQGKADITVMTNMLESRLLCGDQARFDAFQARIHQADLWPAPEFYKAKHQEQKDRHHQADNTAYRLEPNIKNSPGGLRDLQTIGWIANRVHHTDDIQILHSNGLLSDEESTRFINARNLLWQLRNGLHILAKRPEDRLLFAWQSDLASALGYEDTDTHRAVEIMMQRYYRAAKDVDLLNRLSLQYFDELINHADITQVQPIDEHYELVNGYIHHRDPDLFDHSPHHLLTVFECYQKTPGSKGFSAEIIRAVIANVHHIDDAFRANPQHKATFYAFFHYEKRLTHTIRKLDSYGVLAAFLPVYGRIVGQMQHDLFHAYTVDAHTLLVVRNVRRMTIKYHRKELPFPSELIKRTPRHDRLYLAALFHDIAKGRGGNHDKKGARDALDFCLDIGLSREDSEFISWLVLHHLQMSKVSQREDLSDPKVIQDFCQLVGDSEHLDNLYLLTVADIRATSQTTWTPWKGHLLKELYDKSQQFIKSNKAIEKSAEQHILEVQAEAQQLISDRVPKSLLKKYWAMHDPDYFLQHEPRMIAWHAESVGETHALDLPMVVGRYRSTLKVAEFLIYTAETEHLVSTITRTFDKLSLNIEDARIHAGNPGYTLLLFHLTHSHQKPLDDETIDRHIDQLRQALITSRSTTQPSKRLIPKRLQQFEVEPHLAFEDDLDKGETTLTLTALDQPGLMHQVANLFAECHVKLLSARINTHGEKAKDTFTICDHHSHIALSDEKKQCLTSKALERLR